MEYNHRKVEIIDKVVQVNPGATNIQILSLPIQHSGKSNHQVRFEFLVEQPDPNVRHKIRFYVSTNHKIAKWFTENLMNVQNIQLIFQLKKLGWYVEDIQGNDKLKIDNNTELFFVLDNRYFSTITKNVSLKIIEEWDEITSNGLSFLSTVPPYDKSLLSYSEEMIKTTSENLKIITPYIDMSLISIILDKYDEKIDIKIITRNRASFSGKSSKEAFEHIHEKLKTNHRHNDLIHSRIILKDKSEALVSSADLTQDSLLGQFNAGIVTTEKNTVMKLLEYFENVWIKSST